MLDGRPFEEDAGETIMLLPLMNQLKDRRMDELYVFCPPREVWEQNIGSS
jgi:hypothetical protein